jgi:acyl-CoA thioesterase-1
MLEKLVRFQRPETALPYAQQLSQHTLAALFGADEVEYRSALAAIEAQRQTSAARIAAATDMRLKLASLPFKEGDRIVAIGESTTADRLSWFELLQTVLHTERPALELRFHNLAISGATSTQVLASLPSLRRHSPDWVFCMLGSNDSQRFDGPDGPLLVSRDETLRNLTELRRLGVPAHGLNWVWITPTPVDEAVVGSFPYFRSAGISWANTDLAALGRAILRFSDRTVDSAAAVDVNSPDAFIEDGVHPSVASQEALAARVLTHLAEGTRR